jgi:hypothetical protein
MNKDGTALLERVDPEFYGETENDEDWCKLYNYRQER